MGCCSCLADKALCLLATCVVNVKASAKAESTPLASAQGLSPMSSQGSRSMLVPEVLQAHVLLPAVAPGRAAAASRRAEMSAVRGLTGVTLASSSEAAAAFWTGLVRSLFPASLPTGSRTGLPRLVAMRESSF